ncbi:MAG: hypothetical protein HOE02_05690 [Candidatus Marinimicrobia bacterium]|jgi:hypothetical protein|nr:hypothetical protein [Candidatus Neomarinimicrobiota bacterium]
MTTIKEAMAQYYSSGTGGQQWCNQQLAKDMRDPNMAWQQNHLFKGIADKCLEYCPWAVDPNWVVEICDAIGMPTTEKLVPFAEACEVHKFDLSGLFKWTNPVITKRYFTEEINFIDLKQHLHETIPGTFKVLFGPAQHTKDLVYMRDEINILIPYDKLDEQIMFKDPTPRHGYKKDSNDCDDGQAGTTVWMAHQYCGNYTLGWVDANFYQDTTFKGGHAFKIAVCVKPDGTKINRYRGNRDREAGWDQGEEINLPAIQRIVGGFNRMEIIQIVM